MLHSTGSHQIRLQLYICTGRILLSGICVAVLMCAYSIYTCKCLEYIALSLKGPRGPLCNLFIICNVYVFQCICMWCHTDTHIQTHRQHKTTPHIPYYVDACVCVCVLALLAHVHVMTQGVGVSLVTACVAVLTSPHHFQSLCPLPFVLSHITAQSSLRSLS